MHGCIWKRSLAVLLTAALAIQAAPVTSLAVGTEPEASAISGETAASLEYPTGEDAPEPDILAEDETKRSPRQAFPPVGRLLCGGDLQRAGAL